MILAENLHKSYRSRPVLQGIDLHIEKGEFVSVMGKSGSGKSTLLNILAGNLAPDSGSVRLDGRELVGIRESELAKLRRTKMGFVYQALNLIPTLNARDNILLPLCLDRRSFAGRQAAMEELCDRLGISHLLASYPHTMSGGEQQRVAIARAMLHEPSVLMLDEPTGSLDSRSTGEVMELLTRLNREKGVTVVQVTHSEACAAYGSRIIRLSDGRVIQP